MDTLDIPDEHRDRIEALRAELADEHGGPYATVEPNHVLAYLLDLAEAVDDPGREAAPRGETDADPETKGTGDGVPASEAPFDRETVRDQLADRNRKHTGSADGDPMDLYSIAAEFNVTGRSGMTKDELITAIIDRAAALAADPFAAVGVDVDGVVEDDTETAGTAADGTSETEGDSDAADPDETEAAPGETEAAPGETETAPDEAESNPDDSGAENGGSDSGQLNAMMSLLETHNDKWREGDGDARYEVDLPDGGVETARTKDDVRALLFRNY